MIKRGQTLYEVDGKPVILMDATTPAYRDLSPSDSAGQDVLELNRNLVKLGFNPDGIVVDDVWQAATTAGVEQLQASLGETETATLSLGRIVFLPGDQLVSTVDATVGSTGSGSGGSGGANPSSGSNTSAPAGAATPEFVSLGTPSTTTPQPATPGTPKCKPAGRKTARPRAGCKPGNANNANTLRALIALLQAEGAELKAAKSSPNGSAHPGSSGSPSGSYSPSASGSGSPSSGSGSPSSGSGSPSSSGSSGGSAQAILDTTSTQLVVTVDLDAAKQSEAKVGERVTVQLPNGNAVAGRITSVSPVAQSSSSSGSGNGSGSSGGSGSGNGSGSSGATIPVTITLSGHHTGAGLDKAAVSLNFAQAAANNVLSVPVTALLAVAGGGYAVQEAAAPRKLIPVTTGLFAAGYVEISGSGIYPGLQVTDSQG